ncbi:MAG: U6 snRNA-associated Sm-like protein LSm6 [Sulfolobales archaeon]
MPAQQKPESPIKVLRAAMSKTVMVKLKDGSEFVGRLDLTDGTMNVVLSDAVQVREGSDEPATKFGKILIRGSQILYISTDYIATEYGEKSLTG